MGPKFDPTAVYESKYIFYDLFFSYEIFRVLVLVRVTGGEAPGGSSLAPKIGPLGLVNIYNFCSFINTNKILLFL
jgi:hypothetical protein